MFRGPVNEVPPHLVEAIQRAMARRPTSRQI
jgi:hypothetical protein